MSEKVTSDSMREAMDNYLRDSGQKRQQPQCTCKSRFPDPSCVLHRRNGPCFDFEGTRVQGPPPMDEETAHHLRELIKASQEYVREGRHEQAE